jgi:hypothetical protein
MRNVERIFEKRFNSDYAKTSYSTHFPTGDGVQKDRETPPTRPAAGRDKRQQTPHDWKERISRELVQPRHSTV